MEEQSVAHSVLSLRNINHSYEGKPALEHINLDIQPGAFIGLVGPNGGGKTTLVKIILNLLKPDSGEIMLFGKPIRQFQDWSRIGYVSQKSNAFNRGFPATVEEVVAMGLAAKTGYFRFLGKKHKQKIIEALKQVHMLEYAKQNIGDLSGGQQQRVFIARSLVADPDFLILDEPTVGVDSSNVKHFYRLLHELNEKGITLLLITHDTGTMTKYATDVVCLNKTLHFHGRADKYASLGDEAISAMYGHPIQGMSHNH